MNATGRRLQRTTGALADLPRRVAWRSGPRRAQRRTTSPAMRPPPARARSQRPARPGAHGPPVDRVYRRETTPGPAGPEGGEVEARSEGLGLSARAATTGNAAATPRPVPNDVEPTASTAVQRRATRAESARPRRARELHGRCGRWHHVAAAFKAERPARPVRVACAAPPR